MICFDQIIKMRWRIIAILQIGSILQLFKIFDFQILCKKRSLQDQRDALADNLQLLVDKQRLYMKTVAEFQAVKFWFLFYFSLTLINCFVLGVPEERTVKAGIEGMSGINILLPKICIFMDYLLIELIIYIAIFISKAIISLFLLE